MSFTRDKISYKIHIHVTGTEPKTIWPTKRGGRGGVLGEGGWGLGAKDKPF